MILTVDIGNSNTKIVSYKNNEMVEFFIIDNKNNKNIQDKIFNKVYSDILVIYTNKELYNNIFGDKKIKHKTLHDNEYFKEIISKVPDLGQDIFLTAFDKEVDFTFISFGTALVIFNVKTPFINTPTISLGLTNEIEAITTKTDIKKTDISFFVIENSIIEKNTSLIEKKLLEYGNKEVIVTGNDYDLIKRHLNFNHHYIKFYNNQKILKLFYN